MADYTLYCLDGLLKDSGPPIIVDAPDDETAKWKADAVRDGAQSELWQRLRLVARFPKTD